MNYKSSEYNHYFIVKNKYYVYNILTTSLIELEEEIYESLHNGNIEKINEEFIDGLLAEGFIVDSIADEKAHFEYYYDSKRYGDFSKRFKLTLIPTYGCNLACPYCFEGMDKKSNKMTREYVDAVLTFMKNQVNESVNYTPTAEIMISFFGGEPMLCKKDIVYFCEETNKFAKEKNIDVAYEITTNLTLLDDDMVDVIKRYNIEVQVTIDGTKEQHDMRRVYKNGKGTYDIILNNLQKLVEAGVKDLVTIRINLDEDNVQDAEQMLASLQPYAGSMYFGYLMKYKGQNEDYQSECFKNDCYASISVKKLYEIYKKLGFNVPQEFGKKTPCQINSQNTYVVDCNKDVYKCELVIGHKECAVGSLDDDGQFYPNGNFYKQMTYSPLKLEKCKGCKMLPMCGGGCPAREYVNLDKKDGNMLVGECMISESALTEYLTDYIKRNA